jgi:predicted branched-subunit amino acid permease
MLAVAAGARLPEWTGLQLAAPLALAGLLAKSMSGRTATTAAITAGAIAIIGAGLPFHSAVLVAACIGIGLPSIAASRAGHPEVVS